MKRWALIHGGTVASVVEQAEQPDSGGQWVDCTSAAVGPGFAWDGDAFLAPEIAPQRYITPGRFKDRLGAMRVMAIANSTHPVCVGVRALMEGRQYIDLDEPATAQMLGLLVAAEQPEAHPLLPGSGPLTEADVEQILTAPVLDMERP